MTGVANHVLKPQSQAPLVPVPPLPFPDLCARLDDRISAFLRDDDVKDARLRAVQEQTRSALGVIEDALQRYRYACSLPYYPACRPRQLSV